MMRSRLALLFVACALAGYSVPGSAADQGGTEFGRVKKFDQVSEVKITPPEQDPVMTKSKLPTTAETGKQSRAVFTIGKTEGAVTMGPKSHFRFESAVFDEKGLLIDRLDLRIEFGKFWFWFTPPPPAPPGHRPRTVVIKTPTEPVFLLGTGVYISVDPDGTTTVVVLEGAVLVGQGKEEKRVEAGSWTTFGPDQPPLDPLPIKPKTEIGALWPGAPDLPGPVLLDLQSPRLDLPKSIHP